MLKTTDLSLGKQVVKLRTLAHIATHTPEYTVMDSHRCLILSVMDGHTRS